jgi:hypothetical protein
LADPAFGNMTMKTSQFQSVWKQGIVFIVRPPDPRMHQSSEQTKSILSGVITPEGATVYRALQQSAPKTPLPPGP